MTEQALAQSALLMTATSEDALEAAVREHARLVYRIAYSVSRNHHDAEDATQDTFMRVLRYRRKLHGIEGSENLDCTDRMASGGCAGEKAASDFDE